MDVGKIFDMFPEGGKNMKREEFIKQFNELSNLAEVQKDLAAIQGLKDTERINRIVIDRRLK